MADLEEAITVARQAVASTPDDHPDRAGRLNNLGNKLESRYERTGAMADVEEAITVARQAVSSTPDDHPGRAGRLNNLGNKLQSRYERTGEMADLEEAITVARQAVSSTPDDHPGRAGRLNNLGNQLQSRYKRTGEMADLEEAMTVARQAVASTPDDHPDRAGWLNNLGNQLQSRYERTGAMADLEEAITVARQAVASTPDDHPNRATCLNNLGNKLGSRYERTGEMADLEDASSCLLNAWHCRSASPFYRVTAAARCLKLLARQHQIDAAIQLGKDVIDLLPIVNTRQLDRGDQQFVVSIFAGIAADVCAFLLESNQPADALYYLERGRAVIIGQLVDARSDDLRDEVNAPLRPEQDAAAAQVPHRRREAVRELDVCIEEIRGIAGFERFLLGQTAAEMQECASGGTIVVVNVARLRSDAILVSPAGIKMLNLPRLTASHAEVWLGKEWTGRRSERAQKNKEYLGYLSWLWKVCVRQVLDEVCGGGGLADGLPRIWWLGTGLAGSMPFHAAGTHAAGSTENAFDKVVSSYTPSIKALGYARQRARATENAHGSLLIATMPTTPGNGDPQNPQKPSDLPGAMEETNLMADAARHLPIQHLDSPSVEQAVGSLRSCCIAHFACHGYTDHRGPSTSGLILQSYEARVAVQDRLTVRRVSELSLAGARLAYLSACSTAETKAEQLADEVIHVVSGFQVAGFPHVVGCLWPSIDRVCVEVASRFYSSLLRPGNSGWDDRAVASSLREAVMAARATEMGMPLAWAQFVHYGA
ncbi:CHAT domain-containing protein [Coniochaeta sp. 2T2.1]|nr:CHAT domain-containing protein [Coniochaeta sp. 2T2.1]